MMAKVKYTLYIILLLALIPIVLLADTYGGEKMRNLSKEDGLPGETVSDIITGPDGQVWVATSNGVCRYNGRQVMNVPLPHDGHGQNYVYTLCFSPDKTLYAATKQGLFKLGRGDDGFKKIYPNLTNVETVLAVGDIVFAGNRQGFHVLKDGKDHVITVGATPMGIENGVRDIRIGEDKAVWFISRYGLHRYDAKSGRVKSYELSHLLPERSALSRFLPIAGHFFIGTKNNGLYIYSVKDGSIHKVDGIGNSIGSIRQAPDGNVTVSCGGAYLLNGTTGQIIKKFTRRDRDGNGNLLTDAVYCYYRDSNGVDWFGFYRYGMTYTYHSENLFKIYQTEGFTSEGLDVRSVLVNGSQKVIGTADDLWFIDESRHLVRHYDSEQLGDAHAFSNIAFFNGCYYVGTFDSGLYRFSANSFDLLPNNIDPLLSTVTVGAVMNDGHGNLWIGTSEGLFILNSQNQLKHFTENNSSIIGGQINAISFMPGGTTWIGGSTGLCIYNPQTQTFEKDHFPKGFFNSSPIKSICQGHDGLYFFASQDSIYYSDKAMGKFGDFNPSRNMLINDCVSFLDDLNGHYWIATSDGLFCCDYNQDEVMHFGYGEGLRCQLIAGKMFLESNGTVWICTSNGLMYATSADLKRWQGRTRYKLLLYHISIGGEPIGMEAEYEANDDHKLSMKWNFTSSVLTLRPLLADFARPYGRMYEYRLDGDTEWRMVRDGEDITISSLSPGSHTLHIRLAGAPGTLSDYEISVTPSIWAILELVLLIAIIVALFLWRRYHKSTKQLLKERNDIEDALVESEEESEERRVKSEESNSADGKGKYERVHIDEDESKEIIDRLRNYIETEKAYLKPDLKMSDLAEQLHLSPSKLSQVFSLYLKENWYDFINGYRLAEFKRLIADGAYKQYTLLALSSKCGFKKSSFFSTFRKVEGMTPTEYLKKLNIM